MTDSFSQCPGEELAETIGQLAALESAVHRTLLAAIAAFDRTEAWEADGATSVTAWLTGMLNVSWRTATEWVQMAALANLPAIASAYAEGRLSLDQVKALVSFATTDDDAELAEAATGWSAAQTVAVARRARRPSSEEATESHCERSLRMWWGPDRSLHLRGRLPDAEGAVVASAIERIADQVPPDPTTNGFEPYEARCADALVQLASGGLAADLDPDRATVVVHADARLVRAEIEGGPVVSSETARRLACDARLQMVAEGSDGQPVGVGRTTRSIPPWLARIVRRRDDGCRFPSCERKRWVDAHHVVHWVDGGPTDAHNLLSLCRSHHRLVHEDGWRIEGDPTGEIQFFRPDGRVFTHGPPPLRPELRERFLSRAPG